MQLTRAGIGSIVTAWGSTGAPLQVPAGLTGVTAIATGTSASMALKSDGTIVTWGTGYARDVPAGLTGVKAIAESSNYGLALQSDDTVIGWGDGGSGQTTIPSGMTGVTAIAAGPYSAMALKSDGAVVAWGYEGYGTINVPAGLTGVTAISSGEFADLALKSDGTVTSWGDFRYGSAAVPAGLTGVTAVSVGYYNSMALKSDGTVVTWGGSDNNYDAYYCTTYHLYCGSTSTQYTPPAGLTGVTAIAAGPFTDLALKADGTVVSWGPNNWRIPPVPASLHNVTALAAGYYGDVALGLADPAVSSTLSVGSSPRAVAVSPDGTQAYAANEGSNSVSVIDVATGKVSKTIPVGNGPDAVAFSPNGKKAYVTNLGDGTVTVIAVTTGTVSATLAVGSYLLGVAVSPDGTKAYVSNWGNNSILVINVATDTVVATIKTGNNPYGVAFTPDGAHAYVTNYGQNSVSVIDVASGTSTSTIGVGNSVEGVAVSPDGSKIYAVNHMDGSLSVINVSTGMVSATIKVGSNPEGVAFTPDGVQAVVTNRSDNTVSVINVASGAISNTVAVGNNPIGVAISSNGKQAYIANFGDSTVSVITLSVFASMTVSPSSASVPAGTPVTLTAEGYSAQNSSNDLGPVSPVYTTDSNGVVAGSKITFTQVGVHTITATLAGVTATATVTVTPVQVTITATNQSITYGNADPAFTFTTTGLLGNDRLITAPTCTGAGAHSNTGTYLIRCTDADAGSNYTLTYTPGTLTVSPATVVITATNASAIFGAGDPVFTFTTTGLVGSDALLTAPICGVAGVHRNAGTYPIRCAGADAGSNYTLAYAPGTLTVTQAAVVITANNASAVFGAGESVFTFTTTGLLGGDSLLTAPICAVARVHRNAGTYPIRCAGADAGNNYTLSYAPGTLTVTQAPLTVTAPSPTTVYGTSASQVSYAPTLAGLVSGDTASSAGVTPLTCRSTATITAGGSYLAGSYPVTCTGPASTANYLVSYIAGSLTVTKATLTVTGSDAMRQFGASDPLFATTTSRFVNGDTASQAMTGTPVLSTPATLTSHPGSYPINVAVGSLSAANYTFTLVPGAFTITKANTTLSPGGLTITPSLSLGSPGALGGLAITANSLSATLVYGAGSIPATGQILTFSVNGAVLCSGITDGRGAASCTLTPVQLAQVLANRSYTVSFTSTIDLLASTANGTLTPSASSAPAPPGRSRQPR